MNRQSIVNNIITAYFKRKGEVVICSPDKEYELRVALFSSNSTSLCDLFVDPYLDIGSVFNIAQWFGSVYSEIRDNEDMEIKMMSLLLAGKGE